MRLTSNTVLCLVVLLTVGLGLANCSDDKEPLKPTVQLFHLPYENLTDYDFFEGDLKDMNPSEGVLPYDLATPLFSDYAQKARFIYMPPDQSANYQEEEIFDFPVGTVIIKTFYFEDDLSNIGAGKRVLETRLLVKFSDGWEPFSYLWNEEQTEASFSVIGDNVAVSWIHYDGSERSTNYLIPNKNDCKGCHNISSELFPIGPTARSLNKDFDYPEGRMNQITKWVEMGYLRNAPDPAQATRAALWQDESEDLDLRARSYLDTNCAHCHRAEGPAKNSGLFLRFTETDPAKFGICKSPVAAGSGSGGFEYNILPGKPDSSIMIYRMNSSVIDIAMPELARSVIHTEGVELITQWIASMEEGACD